MAEQQVSKVVEYLVIDTYPVSVSKVIEYLVIDHREPDDDFWPFFLRFLSES